MVNGGDLFVCLVAGLAIPLALLDGLRAVSAGPRPDLAHGAMGWLLALVAGPGLFVERMSANWRKGDLDHADAINAIVIGLGWAMLYGYVVLGLCRRILPA